MDYSAFQKTVKGPGGKKRRRWYYYWIDAAGKQHQKICPDCRNRNEAENYIRTLPSLAPAVTSPDEITIAEIAGEMYIPGSAHVNRRVQLGKSAEIETMLECRRYIKYIIALWGDIRLKDLDAAEVMPYLFASKKSGKWKNRFLEVLGEIYTESTWYKCRIIKPKFQRFAYKSNKPDIFTTAELDRLFKPDNFPDEMFYLFFLLSLSAGLRLGEARAVRAKQIIFEHKVLIVDGFCKADGTRTNYNKKGTPENPKFRVVFLPDMTLDKMASWIAAKGLKDDDYCFALKDGRPAWRETYERTFHYALQSAGFIQKSKDKNKRETGLKPIDGRKLVPHSLRYTYISRMRRELTADELKPMTGHVDGEQVDYYNRKVLELALAALPAKGKAATDSLFTESRVM